MFIGGSQTAFEALNLNQVYNPENNTWTTAAPMPTAVADQSVVVLDDKLYATGGSDFMGSYFLTIEQYTPANYGKIPVSVIVISPQEGTYNENSVLLSFTLDEPVSSLVYSLDKQANITVAGNTTLTDLPNGIHNVTVYANDTFGNVGVSQTVNFTISTPATPTMPTAETFPIATVAVISGTSAVIVLGAGLSVYFKKRKKGV